VISLALHGKGSSPEKIGWLTGPLYRFGEVIAPQIDLEVDRALDVVSGFKFDLVAGHSRGGTVALLAAARHGVPVIAISAPTDRIMQRMHLCSYPDGTVQKKLCIEQYGYSESYLRSTSPINFADKIKKALLVHGTKDEIVPVMQSRMMCSRIKESGNGCTLLELSMKHTPPKSLEKQLSEAIIEWIRNDIEQ